MRLALEPINRYETNFVNTVEDGLAVLEEVGAPNFKLLLDTFHMNIEEADIGMSFRRAEGRLGYVHFADSNRHYARQGSQAQPLAGPVGHQHAKPCPFAWNESRP